MNEKVSAKKTVALSTIKMAAATLISRVLGLFREQVMAVLFGASGLTDAFLIAYRIPNLLRDLLAEGAFSAAFVPTFTEVLQKNKEEARQLFWSVLVLLSLVTGAITLFMIIFAKPLVLLFAPTYAADPEKLALTVSLLRFMSPFIFIAAVTALFMGSLNTLKMFFIPSFAPAILNIVMIGCTLSLPFFLRQYGKSEAYALAIGVIFGGIAQLLFLFPNIIRNGFAFTNQIKIISRHTLRILHKVGVGSLGVAAAQLNVLVTTVLATGAGVGAVSWLTYAFRLFQFPIGVLSVSISGSNLVHFSQAWKAGDKNGAVDFLKESYSLTFLVLLPAMALLMAMSAESVNLIFQHGRFTIADTNSTALALKLYLVGLPFYGLYKVFGPTFYALEKPRIPVTISICSLGVNILFCIVTIKHLGFSILAFGTSLAMFLNTVGQAFYLRRELDLGFSFFFDKRIAKVLLASIICYLFTRFLCVEFYNFSGSILLRFISFSLIGAVGAVSFALSLVSMGEMQTLKRILKRRR